MKRMYAYVLLLAMLFAAPCMSQSVSDTALYNSINRLFNKVESDILTTAEAMPDAKFQFTPDSLHIAGAAFDGVRSFAGQIMHLATDNMLMWSAINQQSIPYKIEDVNGPKDIRSKADIIKYLEHSFEIGRAAIKTITVKNQTVLMQYRWRKLSKLDLAFYGIVHANEHYGQMVVYLRMCGIIPPPTKAEQ